MSELRLLSPSEQVAEHLRAELRNGRWKGTIPGVPTLASELGIDRKTVDAALRSLDEEGVLVPQGVGRRRQIALPASQAGTAHPLRIALLPFDVPTLSIGYMIDLRHKLQESGHFVFPSEKTLLDLRMDAARVGRFIGGVDADAWVVTAGSREVLRCFADQPLPTFALFGGRAGLPIAGAGPDAPSAFAAVGHKLAELGHRRISLLIRRQHRLPEPSASALAFLGALESHGIPTGDFNLPDWEESKEGFQTVLESLFKVTPPTALFIDEAYLYAAAQQFITRRGLRVPEYVSLVCMDSDPTFAWCEPTISHVRWDAAPLVRRIVRWAANISQAKEDIRQRWVPAEFVEGGTIGPAKAGS